MSIERRRLVELKQAAIARWPACDEPFDPSTNSRTRSRDAARADGKHEDPKNRRIEEDCHATAFGGLTNKIKQEKGDQEGGLPRLQNTGWWDAGPQPA